MRLRLQGKVVALVIALLVAAQLATFAVVHFATERSVRDQLAQELEVGERVWQRFHRARGEQLLETGLVLADDFGLRAAVASGDPATMASALGNHAARVGADVALLLSPDGRWLAGLDGDPAAWREGAAAPAFEVAREQGFALSVLPVDGDLVMLALIPVLAPEQIGWVGIGTRLDDAYAGEFRALTGLDASFLQWHDGGAEVFASSLPAVTRGELAAMPALPAGGGEDVVLAGDRSFVRVEPLAAGAGARSPQVLLKASLGRAMAPYAALKSRILLLSGLAALLAVAAAGLLGRGITRPLARLAEAVSRVRRGDYAEPIAAPGRDEIGDLARAFGEMQAGIAAREQRILHQAHHDSLTGLPNRSLANVRLDEALAAGTSAGAVLMVDLDRFKEINDTLGHGFGDQVLGEVGKRLRQAVHPGDLVARLGGDEFMVLLHDVDAERAMQRARELLAQLRKPLELPSTRINLDASFGLALHPAHGRDAETLLRRADIALYDAKQSRAGVALYREGRDEVHLRQLALAGELRESVARGQLSLRFQPKVDLASRQVRHVEALLRWRHPSLGQVPPDEFIPLAERSGFVHDITRFVLDAALAQNARWRAEGLDLGIAVNLSAMDLMDADLPAFVQATLARHQMPPPRLILEITEGALMRDVDYAVRMLHKLRALGVRLSIDDFGTGYSSLAQLKRMPVDEMKIDKSFVQHMTDGSDDAVIVRSTIELGHNMGLSVIAEGVESDASLELLRRYRCDMVQGYLFSPPVESEALVDWCRRFAGVPA